MRPQQEEVQEFELQQVQVVDRYTSKVGPLTKPTS